MDGDASVVMELPGGGNFEDVTELFQQAADGGPFPLISPLRCFTNRVTTEMKPGELVMMLSLLESMSAFEVRPST